MTDVESAVQKFVEREKRFPCPAPRDGASKGKDFNEEDCTKKTGNKIVAGTGGEPVIIGKLPAAALKISNDYMRDIHGNYLVYAVTKKLTDATTFAANSGAITVKEKGVEKKKGPNQGKIKLLNTHKKVEYVVVSPGDNGYGTYAYDGKQTDSCKDSKNDEQENCDGDAVFKYSVQSDREKSSLFYDDSMVFESNVASSLPPVCTGAGKFLQFDGTKWTCEDIASATPPNCSGKNKTLQFKNGKWQCKKIEGGGGSDDIAKYIRCGMKGGHPRVGATGSNWTCADGR